MAAQTLATPQVHLHWVRETPSRALELPVSTTLTSIASLPPCAQTAVLATGHSTVELHLPPYRPAHTPNRDAWLAGLRFRQDAAGRLIATSADDPDPLVTMACHHAMVLAIRAITEDSTPLTLVAESVCSSLLPHPLPARHVCAPRGGLLPAPSEHSHFYHRRYRAVSLRIQAALRACVPPAHIESISQFEDRDHLLALFTWSAAEPIVGRHVDALGVDVLNDSAIDRAFAGLSARLLRQLGDVSEFLHRHHAKPLILSSYHPSKAPAIIKRCRSRNRFLNLLFSNEFRLITAIIRFCSRLPNWRDRGAADPGAAFREIRGEWENVELHLRHFYQRRSHSALGSRILLEAVRALEAVD